MEEVVAAEFAAGAGVGFAVPCSAVPIRSWHLPNWHLPYQRKPWGLSAAEYLLPRRSVACCVQPFFAPTAGTPGVSSPPPASVFLPLLLRATSFSWALPGLATAEGQLVMDPWDGLMVLDLEVAG